MVSQGKRQANDETSAEDAVKQPLADSTGADGLPKLKLSDFAYVVLGERLANMVADEQLSYWRVEDLAPATILAAISALPRIWLFCHQDASSCFIRLVTTMTQSTSNGAVLCL